MSTVAATALRVMPVEIRWHGRGGQGVVTASRMLATAALRAGYYPQSLPDFGAERSGAPVAAYSRIGTEPPTVRGPVTAPTAVVVLDLTLVAAVDVLDGLQPGGLVIVNTPRDPGTVRDMLGVRRAIVFTVDATGIATRLTGRPLPNSPMVGALIRAMPIVDLPTMLATLREEMGRTFPRKVVEANAAALTEGYETALAGGLT